MEHVTSPPHYPQSNGKVENSVKTAKNLIKSLKQQDQTYLASLEWRNSFSEGLAQELSSTMDVWISHLNINTYHV